MFIMTDCRCMNRDILQFRRLIIYHPAVYSQSSFPLEPKKGGDSLLLPNGWYRKSRPIVILDILGEKLFVMVLI